MTYESKQKFFNLCYTIANRQQYGDRQLFVNKFCSYVIETSTFPNEFDLSKGMKLTTTNTPQSVEKWVAAMSDRLRKLFMNECAG